MPVDVGFDVIATHAGREWPLGRVSFSAGGMGNYHTGGTLVDFPADLDVVDVIFRANPAAAEGSTRISSIWDGSFTQPSVKIAHR